MTTNEDRSIVGLFIHYDNGDMVNVNSLPKEEYEAFLESMNRLRLAYYTITKLKGGSDDNG